MVDAGFDCSMDAEHDVDKLSFVHRMSNGHFSLNRRLARLGDDQELKTCAVVAKLASGDPVGRDLEIVLKLLRRPLL